MPLNEDRLWALLDDMGAELDVREHADQLDPVVDAIVDELPRAKLERAVEAAASQIWDDDLRGDLAELLATYRQELEQRLRTIEQAERELDVPGRANLVARALVHRAATDVIVATSRAYERLRRLEEQLVATPDARRPSLALEAVVEVAGAAGIPVEDLEDALDGLAASTGADVELLGREAASWLARALATPERRAGMRQGIAELLEAFGPVELPLLRAELASVLAVDPPDDAADDAPWVALVVGLAEIELGVVVERDGSGVASAFVPGASAGRVAG